MNQLNWKKVGLTIIIIIVLLIIIFLVQHYWNLKRGEISKEVSPKQPSTGLPGELTVEDLKKISVPEPGEKAEENIVVPKEAVKAGPETESKLRIFEIKGEKGIISPSMFRVYQNDIINIKLTAIDQDYDFKLEGYNLEIKVKKGETKTIEFQALNPGVFNFYCSLCKTEKMGNVIVVPK